MGIKKTLFADQSAEGRLYKLKQRAKNTTDNSYTNGYYVKNTKETTTVNTALSRVRGGGYVVPAVARHSSARAGYN